MIAHNYREKFTRVLFILMMAALTFGCAAKDVTESGYDTIATSNEAVHRLMLKAGEYYQQGEITESEKEKLSELYLKYRAAANSATEALAAYANASTKENHEIYLSYISDLIEHRQTFINSVKTFFPEDN